MCWAAGVAWQGGQLAEPGCADILLTRGSAAGAGAGSARRHAAGGRRLATDRERPGFKATSNTQTKQNKRTEAALCEGRASGSAKRIQRPPPGLQGPARRTCVHVATRVPCLARSQASSGARGHEHHPGTGRRPYAHSPGLRHEKAQARARAQDRVDRSGQLQGPSSPSCRPLGPLRGLPLWSRNRAEQNPTEGARPWPRARLARARLHASNWAVLPTTEPGGIAGQVTASNLI